MLACVMIAGDSDGRRIAPIIKDGLKARTTMDVKPEIIAESGTVDVAHVISYQAARRRYDQIYLQSGA